MIKYSYYLQPYKVITILLMQATFYFAFHSPFSSYSEISAHLFKPPIQSLSCPQENFCCSTDQIFFFIDTVLVSKFEYILCTSYMRNYSMERRFILNKPVRLHSPCNLTGLHGEYIYLLFYLFTYLCIYLLTYLIKFSFFFWYH